ncbi:DUF298-domain-containing protein [Punctularia strigosozonata HHB-11173 SS5]|uniref:DUF298-domain-containing protein n=1 Tax=Punctularia strigosozonata (strain HHB-11173) TaxID=741275 RepID=UPI0004417D0F|nr:DUF298-domain-containing protein [Punctularia strigosozonata HHB-11173 SS5]EIN08036.1 DUF298-domain-containing protein [Punctularia strigosozonata HHB-11173 SS5]
MPFSLLCCVSDKTFDADEKPSSRNGYSASSNSAIATAGPSSPTVKTPASKPKSKGKPEPYAANRAQELFDAYADEDDKEVIGAEGFERLCSDAGLPLDGALPLVLSWQLDASDMGQISREQWTKGTSALQISNLHALTTCLTDLENLLLLEQEPVKRGSKGVNVPYNREQYFKYADDRKSAFGKLYAFCFILAKQGESRNIQMDIASAFWSVLLAQRYPLMKELLEFIAEKGTYKFVTKDMWNMTWEFVQLTDPNLENYDEAEAWPTLIDEFVAWKKAKAST